MPKVNPNRAIQRHRTADEMHTALGHLINNEQTASVPPQIDDDNIIMLDVIAELLEARQTLEQVNNFVVPMKQTLSRAL